MDDLKMLLMPRVWLGLAVIVTVAAVACGGADAPPPEGAEMEMEMEMDESEPEPMNEPRVFFVAPRDGQEISVDVPVPFEFGIENFDISPVPEEVEQARPAVGHYHLGVDTTCLPDGEIIPQADPWIHFGDGSNTIDMSLEPGEHMFAVQLADDEHRTIAGLCETITIMVEEGI